MQEYSRSLADAVKRARGELGLTQSHCEHRRNR